MRLKYDFADKKELDLIHEYSMKMMEENGIKMCIRDRGNSQRFC